MTFKWLAASLKTAVLSIALAFASSVADVAGADNVPAPVLDAQKQRIEAIAKASKTAVSVFANEGNGGGSGVVITPDGYALTNFHVVQPAGNYMKCGMADGRLYDAVIVGIDPVGDVALIKLLGRDDFPHATMADSDAVRVGDWCFAVGNPFLLATDLQPTVTYGIVSGVHRYQYPAGTLLEYADCLQTDASINPGNSGGPLFNASGDLIGVNGRGSFEKRGRVNVGVGYAISINQIKNFLGCLRSGRIVDHATLGANVGTSADGKVMVSNILESSDAYRRGLRYDDEIVSFGGREISTTNAFKNVLGIYPKGWRVPLTYRRDGVNHDIVVRLAGVHGEEELIELVQRAPKIEEPPQPMPGKPEEAPPKRPDGQPEKTPGGKRGDAPGDRPQLPKLPIPKLPARGKKAETPPPPEVAKLIKPRSGYANYYFNEINRDRVWSAFVAKGDFTSQAGSWSFEGEMAGGGKVQLTLGDDESTGTFPSGAAKVDANKDLDEQLGPTGSGGLLVAMHLWRQMLIGGPQKYGEVYYYGTAPYPGIEPLADVLFGVRNVVETNFVFDPSSGQLTVVEMFADVETDPCILRFSDYRDSGGRLVPFQLEVRHGDKVFAQITWSKIDLAAAKGAQP